jgi:hypothetical protein
MIEFTTVTNEIQSLVARRAALVTFLGSVFAAMGLLLRNITSGCLPPALKGLESHAFAFFAFLLFVPSVVIALRLAKLGAGMTVQAVLYAKLAQTQPFVPPREPLHEARLNWLGVRFLSFLLADVIAGCSAGLFALALEYSPLVAGLLGAGVALVGLWVYRRWHRSAARFALEKMTKEECAPFTRDAWLEHIAESMQEANKGMISDIAFVGLMMFAGIEGMSGLGSIRDGAYDLIADDVKRHGPMVYGGLMVVVAFFGLLINLRIRKAVGSYSLALDPTDKPFRPLRFTDSLLGYLLLAFLFTLAVHLFAYGLVAGQPYLLLAIDAAAFAICLLAEQLMLLRARRRVKGF